MPDVLFPALPALLAILGCSVSEKLLGWTGPVYPAGSSYTMLFVAVIALP